MIGYVVRVSKAEIWAERREGEQLASFRTLAAANDYISTAQHFRAVNGCELIVQVEQWPDPPYRPPMKAA